MTPDPTPDAPDEIRRDLLLVRAIRRITQALDVHSRRMAARDQVTLPQLLCLMAAVSGEGITAKEIGREIHLSPSTLVGVIDRLEAKQLVERSRDRADRRKIHIRPTERGRELVTELPSPFGEEFTDAFSRLSPRRQQEMIRAVVTIAEMIEPRA